MDFLISLLKLLHLLCAIGLSGFIVTCYALWCYFLRQNIYNEANLKGLYRADHVAMGLTALQFLLGVLLVLPKGYAFTTPWIDAAMVLLVIIAILIHIGFTLKKALLKHHKKGYIVALHMVECLKLIAIVLIIHDAVLKQTFLWFL